MAAKQESKPKRIELDIAPAPEAREALTLKQQAGELVIVDRATHSQALEFIKGAKQLRRKIEEHWSRITRSVDEMKRNLLNYKREDLQPVEDAIARAERIALDYETAERRRIAEEEERRRREEEERATAARQAEIERLEREALKAEASSPDLSAREQKFVDAYVGGNGRAGDVFQAAKFAGFADPLKSGSKLIGTPKIQKAIAAARQAVEIRKQAEARRDAPLEVETVAVESELGKAAGVSSRTYYSAVIVDLAKFEAAVKSGAIGFEFVEPNQSALNEAAKRIKKASIFGQAFPGVELRERKGIAG